MTDLLFEAVCSVCGHDFTRMTRSERGRVNRACGELREVDATPEQVKWRAVEFRRRWPNVTLTPQGLTNHWSALAGAEVGLDRAEKLLQTLLSKYRDGESWRRHEAERYCADRLTAEQRGDRGIQAIMAQFKYRIAQ